MSVTLSEKSLFTNVINHYESREEITLDSGWALNSMTYPYKRQKWRRHVEKNVKMETEVDNEETEKAR